MAEAKATEAVPQKHGLCHCRWKQALQGRALYSLCWQDGSLCTVLPLFHQHGLIQSDWSLLPQHSRWLTSTKDCPTCECPRHLLGKANRLYPIRDTDVLRKAVEKARAELLHPDESIKHRCIEKVHVSYIMSYVISWNITWYHINIWYHNLAYDIILWYHSMISYNDIIAWYHNMIS